MKDPTKGKDWEGVDIKDAAAALGIDPTAAAEQILAEFEAAWADSSLFADPANMDKFLNMDAIQASIERQQSAQQGEKNLKALFGIGEDEDVAAVAALGLGIQDGLAGWLDTNGFPAASESLATAIAGGVKENADDIGTGMIDGLEDWITGVEGTDYTSAIGKLLSESVVIKPTMQLPDAPSGAAGEGMIGPLPNPNQSSAPWQGGGGFSPVTVNAYVSQPHDVPLLARQVATYMNKR